MKKITLTLMIVFACFSIGSAQSGKPATAKEIFAFIGWTLVSAFTWGLPFAVFYGAILWCVLKHWIN